jgi:hypothetical protein
MELKTTMVRFNVPKKQMLKRTDNAILFDIEGDKTWIPNKKILVKPSDNENFNEITMPRWVYLKTNLPLYFKAEEFEHITEIR